MRGTLDTLRRFVPIVLAASPRRAAVSALVMVALAFTEGVGLLFLIPLLQLVGVEVAGGSLGRIAEGFATSLAAIGVRPTLGAVLCFYVALIALHTRLGRWHTTLSATVQQDAVALLRTRLYRRIAQMEWGAFVRRRQSDFVHALTGEIDRAGAAAYYLVELAVASLVLAVYLTLAMSVSPETTLVVALCGAALALAARGLLRDSHASGDRSASLRKRLYAAMADHLSGMKAAKSHGAEQRNAESFVALSRDLREINLRMTRESARLRQHTQLGSAAVLAVIVYVARAIIALPTAELLVLLFLFARLMPRLTDLVERTQALAAVLPAFDLVDAVEREAAAAAEPAVTRPVPVCFRRDIRFEGVTFAYAAGQPPAVRDLDLTIEAGSVTALVGASGAGKTTVVDLLLGLLTPAAGHIVIDGEPLTADRIASWRSQIGYVPQDAVLVHDSVRANLLSARPEATDADLWHALALAAADTVVAGLAQGLDTSVGDRGTLLSGGERQRLALARALLRQPRLLILDEATSSLDALNERRIQEAIDGLRQSTTIVVITHRLSAVRTADVIHVLEGGRVADSGTFLQLQARSSGPFAGLRAQEDMLGADAWSEARA